jgi:hypothetical protein
VKPWRSALVLAVGTVLIAAGLTSVQATAASPVTKQMSAAPSWSAEKVKNRQGKRGLTLDRKLISSLKSKDHTTAVKKVKIKLVSAPSKTLWTSTRRTVDVPMQWSITDPKKVIKRIRICTEDLIIDDSWCKGQQLRDYRKSRGDFWMKKTKTGWSVFTAPYYKPRSPYQCGYYEYYRPKVRWTVNVVDPRDGDNLVSARFSWTVRCSG